jgi:hypothetical protein
MPEDVVHKLILLAANMGDMAFSVLANWSYQFLFRVQNEAIPLEAGQASEGVGMLPEGRHSAVWVQEGKVFVRLRTRKHRQQGSLLVRACCCEGRHEVRLCPVHCISLEGLQPGERIFPAMSARLAKKRLRKYLTLLQVAGAGGIGLKTFRASHATNLALQGKPLLQVMQAGEWRSAAVLAYASEEAFDRGQFLATTLEASDSEDSAE